MKSKIQGYIVLDCETGGLPNKDKIATLDIALTELALVYVDKDLEITAKDSFLIKPYDAEYSNKAMEITGLTKEALEKDGITLKEATDRMIDFIRTHQEGKAKPCIVGHNAIGFDIDFIEAMFVMSKKDLYKYVQKTIFDTLTWSHLMYTEAPNYKLGVMATQFDLELTGAHRSLADTIVTAQLWIAMLKNLRGEGTAQSPENIEEVQKEVDDFKF